MTTKRIDQFSTVTPDGTEYVLVQKQADLTYGKTTIATVSAAAAPVQSVAGKTGAVTLTKSDVSLGNVDNTSDASKPVSTAQAAAIALKENTITAGTTSQYYRGDKSFQTLNQDAVPSGTTNKAYSATEQTKLAGVATGATANSADATLLNRANHTGTQAESTVTNLVSDLAGKAATVHTHTESDVTNLTSDLAAKQATLVSGTNLKTINGSTLLGSGDLTIAGGGGGTWGSITGTLSSQTDLNTALTAKAATTYVDAQDSIMGTQALPSTSMLSRVKPSTIVSQFQTGHGFTTSGTVDATTNLNDSSNFVIGTQAATLVSAGAGATCFILRKGMTAVDATSKQFVVVLEVDDTTKLNLPTFTFIAGNGATTSTAFSWQLGTGLATDNSNIVESGNWVYYVLNFANATTTGSPTRSGLTDFYVKVNDTNGGNKATVRVNAIYTIPDAANHTSIPSFTNGLVSITFDDSFSSPIDTGAKAKMDAYGFPGAVYPIWDNLGTGSHLTIQQLKDLQNVSGWEIGHHANLGTNHTAGFPNISTTTLEADIVNEKQNFINNGLRIQGGAYPLGYVNNATVDIIKKYYSYFRTTYNKTLETWPYASPYRLRSISAISPVSGGYSPTLISQTNGVIDQMATHKGWLILTFHKIIGNVISAVNTTGTTYRITYSTSYTPYGTGASITLAGFTPSGLNGTYTVTNSGTTGSNGWIEVSIAANPGTATVQGTALSATTDCDLANFNAIMDKISSSGMTVKTPGQVMDYANQLPASSSSGSGPALSTTIPTADSSIAASAGAALTASASDHVHPIYSFQPSNHGLISWSYEPVLATLASILAASGTSYVIKIPIPVATTITNVLIHVNTAGATLTAGQNFAGLYQNGTLLASTADQSTAWQSGGLKTMALVGGPIAVTAGYVYVAFYANGTTLPTLARAAGIGTLNNLNLASTDYRFATNATGCTTALPGTIGTLTISSLSFWVGVS